MRHKLCNQIICDDDGLLVNLWNDDTGLSGALQSSVKYFVFFLSFFGMSGEIFSNLARRFGPAVNKHNTNFKTC